VVLKLRGARLRGADEGRLEASLDDPRLDLGTVRAARRNQYGAGSEPAKGCEHVAGRDVGNGRPGPGCTEAIGVEGCTSARTTGGGTGTIGVEGCTSARTTGGGAAPGCPGGACEPTAKLAIGADTTGTLGRASAPGVGAVYETASTWRSIAARSLIGPGVVITRTAGSPRIA
jgi:hypothetical protein